MQQRYNFVLSPIDPALTAQFTKLAQQHFLAANDGYVLGPNKAAETGLPHITLCHFRAPNDSVALDAFNSFSQKQDINLRITAFQVKEGTIPPFDGFWMEFAVEKTRELVALQKACCAHLAKRNVEVLTAVEGSFIPHISLARLRMNPNISPKFGEELADKTAAFRPAAGRSSELCVLLSPLFS